MYLVHDATASTLWHGWESISDSQILVWHMWEPLSDSQTLVWHGWEQISDSQTLVVIGTVCIDRCKSNHNTIVTIETPLTQYIAI